ncbi:glycosyltransferase family 2 protein [Pectinatus frisingensis]|uniref:tetratricopeptide repeat-containing glycosyltransferase family 2 protein n=1 Tax=Pectinatus frisingensis TaxID=865 RepID=UPI0018C72DD3|nr:glycosyltransferase family 2 protein [Pectinatus frisingensis]
MYISACVIVKNEEKNIKRWYNSVKDCSDEQIVVDTGSTDGTIAILKTLPVKLYYYKWQDDFAAAKNFAINKAEGNWIIFLDADEYFADGIDLRNSLLMLDKQNVDALLCRMINIDMDDGNTEISRFMQLRIFRNDRDIRYTGEIHEQLVKNGNKLRLLEQKEIIIYHTGYSNQRYLNKIKRNLKILQENIKKSGENIYYYRYLGDCYYALENYTEAVKYYKRHIESQLYSLNNENDIYFNLIDSMIKQKYISQDILNIIKKANDLFPDQPEFIAQHAALNFSDRHYNTAKKFFLQALELYKKNQDLSSDNFTALLPEVYRYLAQIYIYEKKIAKAYLFLNKALLLNRYNYKALQLMGIILQKFSYEYSVNCLSKYYDETIRDILFLSDQFFYIGTKNLFVHYNKVLFDKFGIYSEKWRLWKIVMNESKNDVFEKLLLQTVEKIQLLVTSLLFLGDLPDKYHNVLPRGIWQCLSAYYGKIELTEENFDSYITLLPVVARRTDKNIQQKYFFLGTRFSLNKRAKIFDELCRLEKWQSAGKFLSDDMRQYFGNDMNYVIKMAKIAYYNNDLVKAEKYFEILLQNNYNSAEVKSYLMWIKDRRNSE